MWSEGRTLSGSVNKNACFDQEWDPLNSSGNISIIIIYRGTDKNAICHYNLTQTQDYTLKRIIGQQIFFLKLICIFHNSLHKYMNCGYLYAVYLLI